MKRLIPCAALLALALSFAPQRACAEAAPAGAPPKLEVGAPPRRLEDVHIEGEISVPEVLFITAREQRRFMEFQHHRFLKTSLQLGQATPFPSWILVVHDPSLNARKESSR